MDMDIHPGASVPQNTLHSGRGMVTWNLLDVHPGLLDNKFWGSSIPPSLPAPNLDLHLDFDKPLCITQDYNE